MDNKKAFMQQKFYLTFIAIAVLLLPQIGVAQVSSVISTDTLLYLKFNEASGTGTIDISGRGNNAVLLGGTSRITGIEKGGVHFNAQTDYVSTSAPIPLNRNAFTIAAWVYHDVITSSIERYISIQSEKAVIRHEGNGRISLFFIDINSNLHQLISSQSLMKAGEWHHVAGTWDGNYLKLFFDGAATDSLYTPGVIAFQKAGPALISVPGESLKGSIDEVAVYDNALVKKQIERIYSAPFIDPAVVNNGTDIIIAQADVTKSPYNADSTGINDCTASLQKAIDMVQKAGGGIVYIPKGIYKVAGTLSLGTSVVLSGDWISPDSGGLAKGTILKAYSGKGNSEGTPFIKLADNANSGVSNLTVWYPEQVFPNSNPYPWTISGGTGSSVKNITFINSYNGIFLQPASASTLLNIYGCVLNSGIKMVYASEISWGYDIRFSSNYWTRAPYPITNKPANSGKLSEYLKTNFIAAEYGAMDGYALYGLDAAESQTALLFRKDKRAIAAADSGRLLDVYGFGGQIGKIKGKTDHKEWNPWYYSMPVVNLDNIPDLNNLQYSLSQIYTAAKHTQSDLINVVSYGAVGDGINDDTQAFLDALAVAGSRGGGIVYVPQGRFKITQSLTIPSGVELRGPIGAVLARLLLPEWETTTLLCYAGKNIINPDKATAFITLNGNAGIRGLNIVYPEQTLNAFPYPYTIRGNGSNTWLRDILISNSYNMIDYANVPCNNFIMSGLQGYGMKKGINVGGGTVGGKMEFITNTFGVSTSPRADTLLRNYSFDNSVQYLFGNCSGIKTFGLSGFAPWHSIEFYQENNMGCTNSEFWLSVFDAVKDAAVYFDGGANQKFYGLWTNGIGNTSGNWIKANPNSSSFPSIYGPAVLYSFVNKPLSEFWPSLIPDIKWEESLTTGKPCRGTNYVLRNSWLNAVDNNFWSKWNANPGSELVVNLGAVYSINRFSILNTSMIESKSIYNTNLIELSYSLDSISFYPLTSPASNVPWLSSFFNAGDKFQLDAPLDPVNAKYVKLKVIQGTNPVVGNNLVTIYTFNIFGNPVPVTSAPGVAESETVIDNTADNRSLRIYPNPVTDILHFDYNIPVSSETAIAIVSADGKTVYKKKLSASYARTYKGYIDIKNLRSGVYTLILSAGENFLKAKFMKQ